MYKPVMLTGVVFLAIALAGHASAQQSEPGRKCPIDTTTDKETGKSRNGVQICSEGEGSGSVGFSVTEEELKHFLKYPLGQSDHSVPKDIGHGVEHVGQEAGKALKKIFHWYAEDSSFQTVRRGGRSKLWPLLIVRPA
jgi:hypothetical protein